MYLIKAPQVNLNENGYIYYTCPAALYCIIAMHSINGSCQNRLDFIEDSSMSFVASDIPLTTVVHGPASASVKFEYSRIVLFKSNRPHGLTK